MPAPGATCAPSLPGPRTARGRTPWVRASRRGGTPLAALQDHFLACPRPRHPATGAALLADLAGTQRTPAAGVPRDPRRFRDLRRASRPHRRRTGAPAGRGVPDAACLVGVALCQHRHREARLLHLRHNLLLPASGAAVFGQRRITHPSPDSSGPRSPGRGFHGSQGHRSPPCSGDLWVRAANRKVKS